MTQQPAERPAPSAHREPQGFFVYCFRLGNRYEACRPYFEAEKNADGQECLEVIDPIQDGIRLYLVFSQKPGVVFVRPDGADRPVYACWRDQDRTKGPWRTLHFCDNCPDPEVCGYLSRGCRLSPDGKPKKAFKPKATVRSGPEAGPFGGYLEAMSAGQIWLNQVNNAFQVLHELHGRVWEIEWLKLAGEIYPNEAEFRQRLEKRWTAAIFEGRNPRYAVMAWNTDPQQLRAYIIKKYYVEEQDANPEDAPPLEDAILGVIEATANAVPMELEWMLEKVVDEITDELLQETLKNLADDAAYHTRILLGLPDDMALTPAPLPPLETRPIMRR